MAKSSCKAYNTSSDVNGIAREHSEPQSRPGPIITSIIDNRVADASENPLDGYVIEDGCIPEPFNPIIQGLLMWQTFMSWAVPSTASSRHHLRRSLASLKSLVMGPYASGGAIQRTATYLIMSHDSTEMTLTLDNDELVLSAPSEGQSEHLSTIQKTLSKTIATAGAKMGRSYSYGTYRAQLYIPIGC